MTAIETSVRLFTVTTVEPETEPAVALMVELPAAVAVASPSEPAAFEMPTLAVSVEAQVTCVVMFAVLASE